VKIVYLPSLKSLALKLGRFLGTGLPRRAGLINQTPTLRNDGDEESILYLGSWQ